MTDEAKLLPDEQEDKSLRVRSKSLIGKWFSERWSVLRELWRENIRLIDFYMSPSGGKLSLENAQRITSGEYAFSGERSEDGKLTLVPKTGSREETVDKELSRNLSWDVDNLSWYGLDRVFRANRDLAEQVSIGDISIGKLPKPLGSIRELSYLDSKPICQGHSIRELDLAGLS
jgi:hypothetical protein